MADLKHDVDCRTVIDLENNSGLHVRLEARELRLKHVRSNRETRKDVVTRFIRDRRSLSARGGLSCGDFDARQNGATGILDGAANLSSGRLRPSRTAHQHKSNQAGQWA